MRKFIVVITVYLSIILGFGSRLSGVAQPLLQANLTPEVASPKTSSGLFFPSAISQTKQPTLYLGHEVPYGLWELANSNVAIALPLKGGAIAWQIQQSGFEAYRYWRCSITAAHQLGQVHTGIRINIHQLSATTEGVLYGSSLDASLYMPLTPKLNIGASLQNILQQSLNTSNASLPSSLMLGISYQPFDMVQWQVAVHKNMESRPSILVGLRYEWKKCFFTRIYYQSQPNTIQWALGLKNKRWTTEVLAKKHYLLGISHELRFSWQLPARRNKT